MPRNPHFPPVVGLCAEAPGSGKTTVAKHLERVHGYVNVPTSNILKSMLRLFGLSEEQLNGELKNYPAIMLGGVTPRLALQSLGQWMEANLLTAWRYNWVNTAADVLDHGMGAVNDSVRRQDEIDDVHKLGGVVIRIIRPRGALPNDHAAEKHELSPDFEVVNDGSIGDLYAKIERCLFLYGG